MFLLKWILQNKSLNESSQNCNHDYWYCGRITHKLRVNLGRIHKGFKSKIVTMYFFDNNWIYQMYMYCGTLSLYEWFPLDFCIHLSSTSPFSCTVLVVSQHALLLHTFFLLSLPTNSIFNALWFWKIYSSLSLRRFEFFYSLCERT